MKTLFSKAAGSQALPRINEYPEFQEKSAKLQRLKDELNKVSVEKTNLVNRMNEYSRKPSQVLAEAYLREANPSIDQDRMGTARRIEELCLRYNAIHLAIAAAEQEVLSVTASLSSQAKSLCKDEYRASARVVLAGMLQVERGNRDILRLMDSLEASGYYAVFHPVGPSPWPLWDRPEDPASVWRLILKDFLERDHISASEYERIISGDLDSFAP